MDSESKEVLISIGKSIFGNVPFIGGLLNEALFDCRGRVKQERLNKFIEFLIEEYERKENDKGNALINPEYLKSENFTDSFEEIIKRVIKTSSEEKIKRFRDILVNQIETTSSPDFNETFLDLALNLHEKQIEILNSHYQIKHIAAERELETKLRFETHDFEKEVNKHKNFAAAGKANSYAKMEIEYSKKKGALVQLQNLIEATEVRHTSSYYNLTEEEFLFYIQDMIGKALLVSTSMKPYAVLNITIYGQKFIEFIKKQGV